MDELLHRIEQLEFIVKMQQDQIEFLENKLYDYGSSSELEWETID